MFDDSHIHEAWNTTGEMRAVLIIDIWHPDLSNDEVRVLQFLQAAQIRAAKQASRKGMMAGADDFVGLLERAHGASKTGDAGTSAPIPS